MWHWMSKFQNQSDIELSLWDFDNHSERWNQLAGGNGGKQSNVASETQARA